MNQTVKTSGWLEYARLMRLANVFTAIADPLAGWLVVGGFLPPLLPPVLAPTAKAIS
jgi:hypothetical protein